MSLASRKLIQATAGAAGAADTVDDDFANVVLLLDGDGTSGDDNNTFTDSSTNGFTVTENGSVVQGSFSPYGDNWSVYFDGVFTDYLSVSDSTGFDFGTGDFTVECWFYETGQVGSFTMLGACEGVNQYFGYGTIGTGGMTMYAGYTGTDIYSGTSNNPEPNQWNHLVWQRKDGRGQMYLNGTRVYDAVYSADFGSTASGFQVGRSDSYSNYYAKGYISNFRVIKSLGYYDGASITVPTAPLSPVGTQPLIICKSNRFIDEGNGRTVSVNGTPKVTPFSPFKDDDARDITTDGGSAYFDVADTAYLSFSGGEPSVANMTISGWVYPKTMAPQAGNAYPRVFAAGGFLIYVRDDDIRIYNSAEKVQAPINNNEWTYFAAQRSSNTWTLYINGVSKGTASDSANIALNSTNYIGSNGASNYFTGYIADLRITTSGSTSTAVPTSPVSAVTNTELLLNFQDAGIYDRSGINNLDTVGNAQIDTAVKKYGTGSLEFDGSGDYLETPFDDVYAFGTGDFTVEGWINISTLPTGLYHAPLVSFGGANSSNLSSWIFSYYANSGSGQLIFYRYDGTTETSLTRSWTPNANQWYHIAVSRSGTDLRLFVDGVQLGATFTSSLDYSAVGTQGLLVGHIRTGASGSTYSYLDGYADDVRVTKGVARYTANFTPPTAALPKF